MLAAASAWACVGDAPDLSGNTNADGNDGGAEAGNDSPGVSAPPSLGPAKLSLRDEDPRAGVIAGGIVIGRAASEKDITEYRVHWGTGPTTKLADSKPIAVVNAGGQGDIIFRVVDGLTIPQGATHLLATAANAVGESKDIAGFTIVDNHPRSVDISGTLDYEKNYTRPAPVLSRTTKELLVAFEGSYDNYVRCALDGTMCRRQTLTLPAVLRHLSSFVDETAGKLILTGFRAEGPGQPGADLATCGLDGQACASVVMSAFAPDPSAAYDPVRKKVYVFFSSPSAHPAGAACNVDLTGCGTFLFAGTGSPYAGAIDITSKKMLLVDPGPRVLLAALDATSPVSTDVSGGQPSGSGEEPSIAIDETNRKLVIAARNKNNGDRLGLFTCGIDGTNCHYSDASASRPAGSGKSPSVAIDAKRGAIYVATENETARPSLFRCKADGSSCTHIDLAASLPGTRGVAPKVLIDDVNDRLLVVLETGPTTDLRAGLFLLDLW